MRSSDPGPAAAAGPAQTGVGPAGTALADRWRPGPPPELLAACCQGCGRLSFPPRPQCPHCWQPAETVPLPRCGTLYSFTTVHAGHPAGGPLVLGYADVGGVRVLGPLTGAVPFIGAPVTVAEDSVPGGRSRRYAFRVGGP